MSRPDGSERGCLAGVSLSLSRVGPNPTECLEALSVGIFLSLCYSLAVIVLLSACE